MKYLVKIIVLTSFLIFSTYSLAEQKIVYFNLKYVLNESSAGKSAQDQLKKMFTDNQKRLKNLEEKLKKSEADLIAKQTVLKKEDYQKEADKLRKEVSKYQNDRRISLEKITTIRAEAKETLLSKVNPILKKYSSENNISIILNSTSILSGNPDSDITNLIVDQLNKEFPSIKLK